jgi:hypothetical protein
VARHRVKRAGFLLLLTLAAAFAVQQDGSVTAQEAEPPRPGVVILFVVDPVSFEELLARPEFLNVARAGGAALMTTHVGPDADVIRFARTDATPYLVVAEGRRNPEGGQPLLNTQLGRHGVPVCLHPEPNIFSRASPVTRMAIGADGRVAACPDSALTAGESLLIVVDAGETANLDLESLPTAPRTLLLVVAPEPSAAMDGVGDEVTPLLMATGLDQDLPTGGGPTNALTSSTTRQPGLVSNVDVAPTVLAFFGIPIPEEMEGQPIEVSEKPAPFALHRRHLEQRRIRLPIQFGQLAFVTLGGVAAIAALVALATGRSLSPRVSAALRFLALCGAALMVPLLLGGLLPRLTYGVAVPFVVLSTIGLAVLSRSARWSRSTGPLVFLGAVGLAASVVDASFGWPGARIALLGGTMFDGVRFYGLPNAFIALLLASALFVASRLDPFRGALLLATAALFAGFPSLGANVGASIVLLFAAGLWWVLRTRGRFGPREAVFVVGVVSVGLGVVLVANRWLADMPTHATRFVETRTSIGDVVRVFFDRMQTSLRMVTDVPAGAIPVLGLPVVLWLVSTRPGGIGRGLDVAGEGWRHALVVLTVAGIVAFLVEDTGVAAAGPVFLYAMAGLAYPTLLVE